MVNEANETVGTIDDLIVTPDGQAPYAVLSVGGFLGLGVDDEVHREDDKVEAHGEEQHRWECSEELSDDEAEDAAGPGLRRGHGDHGFDD